MAKHIFSIQLEYPLRRSVEKYHAKVRFIYDEPVIDAAEDALEFTALHARVAIFLCGKIYGSGGEDGDDTISSPAAAYGTHGAWR